MTFFKLIKYPCLLVFLFLLGGCTSVGGKIESWEREKDVENLIRVLKDSQSPHRYEAAAALGAIGDPKAVEALIGALEEKNQKLQISIISALGKIGDKKAVTPLIGILRKGYSGLTGGPTPGMGKGPPQRGKMKQGGESFDTYQRKILLQAQLRKEAIFALGHIGDRRGVDILSGAIWDGRSEDVSRAAVETLAKMGGEDTAPALLDALGTCNFHIRQIAATALANLKPPSTLLLHKNLDDKNPCLREGAAQTIGLIGDSQSVGKLIPMLDDENYGVRLQVSSSLARIGEAAVGPLIEALDKDNVSARKWACRTLGIIGSTRSASPILRTLGDEALVVRKAAASALYELADETSLFHLLGRLPFAETEQKILLIKKIARLGDPRAASALKAEARDPDPGVHQAATRALEKMTPLQ